MPAHYCPICGAGTDLPIEANPSYPDAKIHRCRKKVLVGIDAAMSSEQEPRTAPPDEAQRLREGFRMLMASEKSCEYP